MEPIRENPGGAGAAAGEEPANPATGAAAAIPRHVAIIMDGNGRWALARGLPRIAGHRAGAENLRPIIEGAIELGIGWLTLFAFSTENWARPEGEVQALFSILRELLDRELPELHRNGVRVRHIGHLDRLGASLREKIQEAIDLTRDNRRVVLTVAFDYGGRDEIVHAARRMIREGVDPESVDEALVGRYLFTSEMPDPDLVIRTSGELRVSNFLLWQSAYAEWYFTHVYWPDFGKEELGRAVRDFALRERRFGRISTERDGG